MCCSSLVIAELLRCGSILFVISAFAGFSTRDTRTRIAAASVLRCSISDSQHGQRALSLLSLLLPQPIISYVASDCVRAVQVFDEFHESPELIWNEPMRTELKTLIANEVSATERMGEWVPQMRPLVFEQLRDELMVCALFINSVLMFR